MIKQISCFTGDYGPCRNFADSRKPVVRKCPKRILGLPSVASTLAPPPLTLYPKETVFRGISAQKNGCCGKERHLAPTEKGVDSFVRMSRAASGSFPACLCFQVFAVTPVDVQSSRSVRSCSLCVVIQLKAASAFRVFGSFSLFRCPLASRTGRVDKSPISLRLW